MDTNTLAGKIMAHAFHDELEKISNVAGAGMSATKKMLLAGAGGLGIGGAAGAVGGYKKGYADEQKRFSPQELKVMNVGMSRAYQKGNVDMYKRVRAASARKRAMQQAYLAGHTAGGVKKK